MQLVHVSLWAAMLGAMTDPASGAACADVIGINASPRDQRELRKLLRASSLASLHSDSCRDYRVRLSTGKEQGWTVSMTSRSSTRRFERHVTKLSYAATWIEAWTQSGFAPAGDDGKPVPEASTAPPPAVAPPTGVSAAPAPPASILLGMGPLAAVTSEGFGFAGASLLVGYPARRTPWFGVELGAATQIGAGGSDYRHAYWAGPTVGGSFALSDRWHLRPALSLGIMGTAVGMNGQSATASPAYAGLGGDVEFDVTSHLSLTAGFDARMVFGSRAGFVDSTTTKTEEGETETSTVSTLSGGVGHVWAGLRLGVVWQFGSSP